MLRYLLDTGHVTLFQHGHPLIRIGTQYRNIAAIAVANHVILVTANRRDFPRVPGLTLGDWSV
jgi:predicted nucleic acid-binding protein